MTDKQLPTIIESIEGDYARAVTEHQWGLVPSSQLHAAAQQLMKSEYTMRVAQNNPQSVQASIINAGILGLDLSDGRREGWLIPRRIGNKQAIVLQVGYKGHEAIAQRLGIIKSVEPRIVHQEDVFEWSGSSADEPKHQGKWFTPGERGPIVGVFTVTRFHDGTVQVVVTPIKVIYEKHRNISDSWKSYQAKLGEGESPRKPVWLTFEEEMIKKTAIYIASKQWPAKATDPGLSERVLSKLHEVDTADYQGMRQGYTAEQMEAFQRYVEAGNGLGVYLMQLYLSNDIYADLVGAIVKDVPRGGKMKMRESINAANDLGRRVLGHIKELFAENDEMGVLQYLEDADEPLLAMVDHVLSAEESGKLHIILKQAKESE